MSKDNYFEKLRKDFSLSKEKDSNCQETANGNANDWDYDSESKNNRKKAACLKFFDKNRDGALNADEFHALCGDLFVGESSTPDKTLTNKIFDQLDENKDGQIDSKEFRILWKYWLPLVLAPKSALIIVDVQNDFVTGTLPVPGGEEIVPVINKLLDDVEFDQVYYTFDWHPVDHISFFENLSMRELSSASLIKKEDAKLFDTVIFDGPVEQRLWPAHCVQKSKGAQLHPDLKEVANCTQIYKGKQSHIDSYSAFFDNQHLSQTELAADLCSRRITDVFTCGLATDVCVKHTAIDSSSLGFRTFVIEDAGRAITDENHQLAKEEMKKNGCRIVSSSQVKSLVTGQTRSPEMGLKAALNVADARRKARERMAKGDSKHAEANGNVTILDL